MRQRPRDRVGDQLHDPAGGLGAAGGRHDDHLAVGGVDLRQLAAAHRRWPAGRSRRRRPAGSRVVSSVTGTTPESIRSPSTWPGPIEGSCAGSPTSSRWVPSAQASSSAAVSSTSSIEASSTTTTSASSGHSSLRANPPVMPCAPSSRCTVVAGWSVSSSSRLAARPVGAASATSVPLACSSFTIAATVRLLPVPGPPVSRLTPGAQHLGHRRPSAPGPAPWPPSAPTPGRRSARRWRPAGRRSRRRPPRPCRSGPGDSVRSAGSGSASLGLLVGSGARARARRRTRRRRPPRRPGRRRPRRAARRRTRSAGQHGVPVAGGRAQGQRDDRPAAAAVLPVGALAGPRWPAGRRRPA